MVIKSVDRSDSGEYFCRAQNSEGFGRDSVSFHVEIKGKICISFKQNWLILKATLEPIRFLAKPDSVYHVHENDHLILPCLVFGNPQPKIKWLKVWIDSCFLTYIRIKLFLTWLEFDRIEWSKWKFNDRACY